MPQLITVPTFQFDQGHLFQEEGSEMHVNVRYWPDGVIELEQDGHSIVLNKKHFDKFCKEVKRHLPAAEKALKEKK